jgi:ubiquinone/menaquinone biosynthesis C-methylase UbiE
MNINKQYISCTKCEYSLKNINGIYVSNKVQQNYKEFYDFTGTQLRERAKAGFSTSKYEFQVYKDFILDTVDKHLGSDKLIFEIGAGDGRITELLIKKHFVIANDINYKSLKRFQSSLTEKELEKIMFISSSFEYMPVFKEQIDMLVAIESLLYSNAKFENLLNDLLKNIKSNGYFIDSEPIKSSAILYSLINNEYENIISLINGTKNEKLLNESIIKSRVFTKQELNNIYKVSNLYIETQSGTPELISIISLLLSQNKIDFDLAKKILDNNLCDYKDNYRCLISLLKLP